MDIGFLLHIFPSNQASATDLFINLWSAVSLLNSYGFDVEYTSLDRCYNK